MKNITQLRKKSQTDAIDDSEETDAKCIDYHNLKNSPTESEVEDLEFVNPLFKKQATLFNSTVDNIDDIEKPTEEKQDYDKLEFNNKNTNSGPPKVSPRPRTKQEKPEEIQMGVSNYGYINEKARPDSWDSSLSVFNPAAVGTPIRRPVDDNQRSASIGIEMSESPPLDNRISTISKQSDYSSITDVSPYIVSEKGPQYEDLAGIRSNHKNGKRPDTGRPTPPGHKKTNMLYEPAVISQKTAINKRLSVENTGGYEEHSSYCHLIFTILVGILAIIALVVVFLVIFGGVSAKKCKECDVTNPSTGASTGNGGSGTGISQAELDKQLNFIKGNLSLLQKVLHQNSSITIATLQEELDQQKAAVSTLTQQLDEQKVLTNAINIQTQALQIRLDHTNNKLDKVNQSVTLKTSQINVRITNSEITAGQNLSDVKKTIVDSHAAIFDSMNNNSKRIENSISEKASKTNLTILKMEVEKSNKILTKMVVASNFRSTTLNTSLQNMVSQVNTTLSQNLIDMKTYAGRIEKNLTLAFQEIQNISVIEGPQGPPGLNGTRGFNGSSVSGIQSCVFRTAKSSQKQSTVKNTIARAYTAEKTMNQTIGASCSGKARYIQFHQDTANQRFFCECTGVHENNTPLECRITYWLCSK